MGHTPYAARSRDAFIAAVDAILFGGGLRAAVLVNGTPSTVEDGLFSVVGNESRAPGMLAEQVRAIVGDLFVDGTYDALARRLITAMGRIEVRREEEREAQAQSDGKHPIGAAFAA